MRHIPDSLMLFAAGFGTRMGAMTAERPKPLIPVAGRALIDHALDLTNGLRLKRILVNLHYRADMIRSHLEDRADIVFSAETETILETGGGLKAALPMLPGSPVLTLNTDAVWSGPNPLLVLGDAWDGSRMDALLLMVPTESAIGHRGRGDFAADTQGRLRRGTGFIYVGAQIIRTEAVAAVPDRVFSLNRVWDAMASSGRLFGAVYPGRWCDVGQPQSIALAETMLAKARDV
jgi:N-acetyl-alpha-D-muramate 1-phosphate uridylyltransferase